MANLPLCHNGTRAHRIKRGLIFPNPEFRKQPKLIRVLDVGRSKDDQFRAIGLQTGNRPEHIGLWVHLRSDEQLWLPRRPDGHVVDWRGQSPPLPDDVYPGDLFPSPAGDLEYVVDDEEGHYSLELENFDAVNTSRPQILERRTFVPKQGYEQWDLHMAQTNEAAPKKRTLRRYLFADNEPIIFPPQHVKLPYSPAQYHFDGPYLDHRHDAIWYLAPHPTGRGRWSKDVHDPMTENMYRGTVPHWGKLPRPLPSFLEKIAANDPRMNGIMIPRADMLTRYTGEVARVVPDTMRYEGE